MQNNMSFCAVMKWQKVTILVCILAVFPVFSAKIFAQEEQQETAQEAAQQESQAEASESELLNQSDSIQATETDLATESQPASQESADEANQAQNADSESTEQQEQAAPQAAPRRRPQTGQVVTLSSTIVGNQEQPQVLYIVPWKPVGDSDLENQNIQSQLDIIFGHVERVELRRELLYMEQFAEAEEKTESN